jgi:hypothetical protein
MHTLNITNPMKVSTQVNNKVARFKLREQEGGNHKGRE